MYAFKKIIPNKLLVFTVCISLATVTLLLLGGNTYLDVRKTSQLVDSAVPFSQKLDDPKERFLILGDSLAYGVGASRPENSVAGLIGSQCPSSTIINEAVIGETTESLAKEIENLVDGYYDHIYVIVGGNDIVRYGIDLSESKENLEKIFEHSSTNSKSVTVLTSGDFSNVSSVPFFLKGYYSNRSKELRNHSISLASRYTNANYVDFFQMEPSEYSNYEAIDGFHLNDLGTEKLVDRMLDLAACH